MPQVRSIGECVLEWQCSDYGFGGMMCSLIMVHGIVVL